MSDTVQKNTDVWHWIVCAIYFFAGITALGYEVLWARMLSNIFGVSIFGIVVTVAAFMAGLGAGSLLGSKLVTRVEAPLLVFAVLECAVAIFAFFLPQIFSSLDIYIQNFSSDSSYSTWVFIQSLFTFVVMFIPALLLGVGFPMILSVLKSSNIEIGLIYGINTLGGVLGCLIPLMLLPSLGWTDSLHAFVYLGASVVVLSLFIVFTQKPSASTTNQGAKKSSPRLNMLLAYSAVGAGSIMLQIVWTRLFGMVLLRTEYVMAIILASFLMGIGFGSVLAAKFKSINIIFFLAVAVAISSLASVYLLPAISAWAETMQYSSLTMSMLLQGLVICIFTLPATLAFGAWLPVITSQFSEKEDAGAKIYGFNAIGAAVGGLISGFVILPLLGSTAVIFVATLLILIASLYWIDNNYQKILPVVFVGLFIPVFAFPPVSQLLPSSQQDSKDLSFYEDAVSLTHVIEDSSGQRLLLADLQRMDASTDPTAVTVQKNQSRLPLLLHPNPESVLFLGLGTGITAAGSLPYAELQRTAVELSKGAIDASAEWFAPINLSIHEKTEIVHDDARRFLKSTESQFDVIVGDLFHPDLVGRSALLSLQQFERAKIRLKQDGLFVQWVALNQFDLSTLKVVLSTFNTIFPNAVLYLDGFRLAMVGYNGQAHGLAAMKSSVSPLSSKQLDDITGKEGLFTWVSRYWGKIEEIGGRVQDEWAPVIEFQLPKAKFNRQIDLVALLNYLQKNRPSVDQAIIELGVTKDDVENFVNSYKANELYYESWISIFAGKQLEGERLLMQAYELNKKDQWVGFGIADSMFSSLEHAKTQGIDELSALKRILSIRADHIDALKALLRISEEKGFDAQTAALKVMLKELSPLDKDLI